MINDIKMYLMQGKYEELEKICENIEISKIREKMIIIAYETENISVFNFAKYMVQKTNHREWIKMLIDIMINPLCFVEGAYSVALFYARKLLSLDRNVENLEKMLFFYNIPEKLLHIEEAVDIVEEILKIEPQNRIALEIKFQQKENENE